VIVSHFAYLYNRDKEGRKSRALELLTGQHSGNPRTSQRLSGESPGSPEPMISIFFSLECSNGHHQYQNTESTKASFESDAAKLDDSDENFKPVFSDSYN